MNIAEVSKKYDITPDTLRYYERIGLIPKVRRKGNIRDYSEADCGWVEFIKCMRGAGMQVEALIEYVALFQQGDATADIRKQILIKQRERLREKHATLQKILERLDYKIANYSQSLRAAEQGLKK
ncbi:MAG: MerR family transcriptional regulator [Zoogloeaceae bacterium]|jgi:DNA-binding transcriptional MerR regulator|nr:MerR family transcriptional regulator [Zoogloeaceae bacterium]